MCYGCCTKLDPMDCLVPFTMLCLCCTAPSEVLFLFKVYEASPIADFYLEVDSLDCPRCSCSLKTLLVTLEMECLFMEFYLMDCWLVGRAPWEVMLVWVTFMTWLLLAIAFLPVVLLITSVMSCVALWVCGAFLLRLKLAVKLAPDLLMVEFITLFVSWSFSWRF